MLLTPQRRKFRKPIIRSIKWASIRWSAISFWEYWIKATTSWYITNKQLEAARKVVVKGIKKVGKIWLRVFPAMPFTKKWLEMPMGTGKWEVDIYTALVRKWKVILEVSWLSREEAHKALIQAGKKLPVSVRVVEKWEIR